VTGRLGGIGAMRTAHLDQLATSLSLIALQKRLAGDEDQFSAEHSGVER
jgi:hypothetical protein